MSGKEPLHLRFVAIWVRFSSSDYVEEWMSSKCLAEVTYTQVFHNSCTLSHASEKKMALSGIYLKFRLSNHRDYFIPREHVF